MKLIRLTLIAAIVSFAPSALADIPPRDPEPDNSGCSASADPLSLAGVACAGLALLVSRRRAR